jgi:hypothetical protein
VINDNVKHPVKCAKTVLKALALSKNCLLIEQEEDCEGTSGLAFRGFSRDTNRSMFHSSDTLFSCGVKNSWEALAEALATSGIKDFERNSLRTDRALNKVKIDPGKSIQIKQVPL